MEPRPVRKGPATESQCGSPYRYRWGRDRQGAGEPDIRVRLTRSLPVAAPSDASFSSGDLKLNGWLSANARDGKKRPAVVFLYGGWAFGKDDGEDAEPFVRAGFVLFVPVLRGRTATPAPTRTPSAR
ncbi:hypothetical protein FTUN_3563 [Frigoriglobus tundricola]|uniref:Uncharacterized protein n=1 Tax=Frigoriglobus tundricola TaxID=2774151 RepID=A0A6M5YPM7_9BACT|nr:hypothetical protein FTUN_3563 [Frigoriglobus tundricola]